MSTRIAYAAALALLPALVAGCGDGGGMSSRKLEACAGAARCDDAPMFVIDRLDFAAVEADGSVNGFDVDNLVSDGEAAADCHAGDYVDPAGHAGIDNQVAKLLDAIGPGYAEQVPATIQSLIGGGGLLLLLESVGVRLDDGEGSGALVIRAGDGVPLVGTDSMLLRDQTFALEPEPLLALTETLSLAGGRAHAGPFVFDLRFYFLSTRIRLPIQATQVTFVTTADDGIAGVLGGYVAIDDALGAARFVGGDDAELGQALQALLPTLADVRVPDGGCGGISMAFTFHAVPAYVFDDPAQPVDVLSPAYLFDKGTCGGCHQVAGVPGATGFLGPALDGLSGRAGSTVTGQTADAYVREAILDPGAYRVPGYEGTMPDDLARFLTDEEFEILVAWLLTR